jgi:hypothetical protein
LPVASGTVRILIRKTFRPCYYPDFSDRAKAIMLWAL